MSEAHRLTIAVVFAASLFGQPSARQDQATGVTLDLAGKYAEAREHFTKAIEIAPDARTKAAAQRAMAISYAFEGNCPETVKYEQQVLDYYISVKDFYNQGEIADEAARVCIDAGDLNTAEHWYRTGHDLGLREPNISPDRVDLWDFRWEHAQARIAARRGNQAEAQRHVAAAKAILDKGNIPEQQQFFPYLTGYVAFYEGDFKTALEDFQKASQSDPFILCMLGQTYEKLGDRDKAIECYRKAAMITAHNPPGAFARPFAKKKLG